MNKKLLVPLIAICLGITSVSAQSNETQELVNNIKANLAKSKQSLMQYSWIETQTVFYKGEQKSTKQYQCYYSVDGQLQKVETGAGTAPAKKRGIRGKIVANKVDNITEYVEKAVALVKTYLPPEPAKLQQIYGAGNVAINILVPGEQFKLGFPGYNLPGDLLSISINKTSQMLMGVAVSTYIDDAKDVVSFNMTYKTLPDGTQYAAETNLVASAKDVKIVLVNSGYTKGKQ